MGCVWQLREGLWTSGYVDIVRLLMPKAKSAWVVPQHSERRMGFERGLPCLCGFSTWGCGIRTFLPSPVITRTHLPMSLMGRCHGIERADCLVRYNQPRHMGVEAAFRVTRVTP